VSSSIPLIKYPIDWTGQATSNRVLREPRTIGATTGRAFVPDGGPFFAESIRVYNAATGIPLTRDQFKVLHPFEAASKRAGKEIASVIYIEDKTVGTEILYDAQILGGEFSWATHVIEEALQNINLDGRPVAWGDLLDIPTSFRPTPHLHDVGDTYGWEYILAELERIRMAILIGDAESHEELRRQYMYLIGELRAEFDAAMIEVNSHINNKNNPHGVTAAQVGLGSVENNPMASLPEAQAAAALNRYMSPRRTKELFEAVFLPMLQAHLGDRENPHGVTPAQIGTYNAAQIDAKDATKLGKEETAVNSLAFAGRNWTDAYNQIRANLAAALVTSGIFAPARLGSGSPSGTKVLMGGGSTAVWTDFEQLIGQYMAEKGVGQIYYAGVLANYGPGGGSSYSAAFSIVQNTYVSPTLYPPGTIVIFKGTYYESVGTGNGSTWVQRSFTAMVIKLEGGDWTRIL